MISPPCRATALTLVSQDAVATDALAGGGIRRHPRRVGRLRRRPGGRSRAPRTPRRRCIAEAAALAPLVLVDGQKHDGVESLLKAVKAAWPRSPATFAKAHGKLFWVEGARLSRLGRCGPREVGGFVTRPGVFSADGPDKGSLALVDALPPLAGQVADLGAGWGFLARHILDSRRRHPARTWSRPTPSRSTAPART